MKRLALLLRRWWGVVTIAQAVSLFLIVAAETAYLYPVFNRAQERARESSCANNLKGVAQALMMYLDDNNDTLPSSVVCATGSAPTEQEITKFLTATFTGAPPTGTKPVSWGQILLPYISLWESRVYCPSDVLQTTLSYWWVAAIDQAWRTLGVRSATQFCCPSEQIVFYEHSAWHYGGARGIREQSLINAVCLDGHVQRLIVRNGPKAYPSKTDEQSGQASRRTGAPMYFNYDTAKAAFHPGVTDYVDPRVYSHSGY